MKKRVDSALEVIVLAAGKGTRMRSEIPKVMHELAGEPLLAHVLRNIKALNPDAVHVVVGHGAGQVRARFEQENVNWVIQQQQLGTGHAVMTALPGISSGARVMVVYGDIPLAGTKALQPLVDMCSPDRLALLTVDLDEPYGYGRIVRNDSGNVVAIVEQKDASPKQLETREINTGIMVAYKADLERWLNRLSNSNAQAEYYLTDVIEIAVGQGGSVADSKAPEPLEVMGVNTKVELAGLERYLRRHRAGALLDQGVTIVDPDRIDVRGDVHFGIDCVVDVNVVLEGPLQIGDGVHIGPHNVIRRSVLGPNVVIRPQCVIEDAEIGGGSTVGPFSRIRPGARIADHVHIGNFVEIKNSDVAAGAKVNHLSYVGDSTIGCNVNIGAGVITCNYDGAGKHRTEIEDDVFVGSNCALVAPVRLGKGTTVGAGSTITEDVPSDNLAIARSLQKNIEGWIRPRKKIDRG